MLGRVGQMDAQTNHFEPDVFENFVVTNKEYHKNSQMHLIDSYSGEWKTL